MLKGLSLLGEHMIYVRQTDGVCTFTSETDDETDIGLVNRLWRFLERETRNAAQRAREREERGVATEPNERENELAMQCKQTSLALSSAPPP